jgi:hypothetical protein
MTPIQVLVNITAAMLIGVYVYAKLKTKSVEPGARRLYDVRVAMMLYLSGTMLVALYVLDISNTLGTAFLGGLYVVMFLLSMFGWRVAMTRLAVC